MESLLFAMKIFEMFLNSSVSKAPANLVTWKIITVLYN